MIIDFCQGCEKKKVSIIVLSSLFIHVPILQSSMEGNQNFLHDVLHVVCRILRNSAEKLDIWQPCLKIFLLFSK